MRAVFAAAFAVATLASASGVFPSVSAQRPAAREARVPFTPGETLTYDVSWSSYLVAGTAVMTVKDKRSSLSSTAYHVVAEGRPAPLLATLLTLYYKMDTLLDSVTLLPQRSSLYLEDGAQKRLATTRFDRTARRAFFDVQSDTTVTSNFEIPPQAQDGLSALYVLRAMTFKTGHRLTLPVVDDGVVYSVHVQAAATERVRVPYGQLDAWKLETSIVDAQGQAVADGAAVWISTDARRLPIKLQAELPVGTFVLALREAR